ncbi:MAG: DUF6731 family protein [Syntrophales bacterium]|jgi:hypothetical protein
MRKRLKFDFYQVIMPSDSAITFGDMLDKINALEGKARLYASGSYPIRLQYLNHGPSDFLGDIARIRMDDIPPKMKLSGETEVLDLDDDEGLGEITSFIYHSATSILMLMRNRNAVSISGLANYVEYIFEIRGIKFQPILHEEAYKRIENLLKIQRFDLEVAGPGNGKIFQDMGLSPEVALDLMDHSPRVRISIAFSTGYDRDLSLPKKIIMSIAEKFQKRKAEDEAESRSLIISGRDDMYEKEVIDLFDNYLTDSYDIQLKEQRIITDDQRRHVTRKIWESHRERLLQTYAKLE